MKALSLMQPWAGLMVLGIKKNETRSWNTKHRGLLAIHASAKIPTVGWQLLDFLKGNVDGFELNSPNWKVCTKTGLVLGTVNIYHTASTDEQGLPQTSLENLLGDYSSKRWIWESKDAIMFDKPVPAKGKLQLWDFNPDPSKWIY